MNKISKIYDTEKSCGDKETLSNTIEFDNDKLNTPTKNDKSISIIDELKSEFCLNKSAEASSLNSCKSSTMPKKRPKILILKDSNKNNLKNIVSDFDDNYNDNCNINNDIDIENEINNDNTINANKNIIKKSSLNSYLDENNRIHLKTSFKFSLDFLGNKGKPNKKDINGETKNVNDLEKDEKFKEFSTLLSNKLSENINQNNSNNNNDFLSNKIERKEYMNYNCLDDLNEDDDDLDDLCDIDINEDKHVSGTCINKYNRCQFNKPFLPECSASLNNDNINEGFTFQRLDPLESARFNILNDNDYTEIIEDFLYLSSYKTASTISDLKKLKINVIINCSGELCENIGGSSFEYFTYYLKDNVQENIECLFYLVLEILEKAKNEGKRVLIHCFKGISRSVSLVLCYLIYSQNFDYDSSFDYVQKRRGIANPNIGFYLQLRGFERKIREKSDRIEIYLVSSFQVEQPKILVAREVFCGKLNKHNSSNIDDLQSSEENEEKCLSEEGKKHVDINEKGLYIFVSKHFCYIYKGANLIEENIREYENFANNYLNLIKKYEPFIECDNNIEKPITVSNNEKDENYIKLKEILDKFEIELNFVENDKYDKYFINLSEDGNIIKKKDKEEIKTVRKGFYVYPNEEYYRVLNIDDLDSSDFLIACLEEEKSRTMFIWQGPECQEKNENLEKYKAFIKTNFFNNEIYNEKIEVPFEESEKFMELL